MKEINFMEIIDGKTLKIKNKRQSIKKLKKLQ